MTEEKKKEVEVWTIDELVELTEKVQTDSITYLEKELPIQWCDLVESEEPKVDLAAVDSADESTKQELFAKFGTERVLAMIEKANKKNPEGASITRDSWDKIPATIRWQLSGTVLGNKDTGENFR
jgi:hypothetical protein